MYYELGGWFLIAKGGLEACYQIITKNTTEISPKFVIRFIHITNSKGYIIDPCGTPVFILI